MGSGRHGPYDVSQPFAPYYHVEKNMKKADMEKGVFSNGKYNKNPTAKNLKDLIDGNYIGNKRTNIIMPYVVTTSGDIIVGKRNGNGKDGLPTPHPTLVGGANPEVAMAGMLHIQGGKIVSYDNMSGHFKPNIKSMFVADNAFDTLPKSIFRKKGGH